MDRFLFFFFFLILFPFFRIHLAYTHSFYLDFNAPMAFYIYLNTWLNSSYTRLLMHWTDTTSSLFSKYIHNGNEIILLSFEFLWFSFRVFLCGRGERGEPLWCLTLEIYFSVLRTLISSMIMWRRCASYSNDAHSLPPSTRRFWDVWYDDAGFYMKYDANKINVTVSIR